MRKFKTESKKLLDLMINSIYTNREIFLRELISNASDAVDKLYFRSLTDEGLQVNRADLAITVSFDSNARTVTVSDNGIGMGKDDLDRNLGTIAHSDSFEFKAENAEDKTSDVDIIGQFGVGFTPRSWWARRCASSRARSAPTRLGPGSPTASRATPSRRPSARSTAPTSSCT